MDITSILSFKNVEIPIEYLYQVQHSAASRTLYIQPHGQYAKCIKEKFYKANLNFRDTTSFIIVNEIDTVYIKS